MTGLTIRKAEPFDAKIFFDWANDPVVRKNALNTDSIEWLSHKVWFEKKIDSDSILLILSKHDSPVGQIRFDNVGHETYLLSYSIDEKFRGEGLGKKIVEKGIAHFVRQKISAKILAQVKKGNERSNKIFHGFGFSCKEKRMQNGEFINEYVLSLLAK